MARWTKLLRDGLYATTLGLGSLCEIVITWSYLGFGCVHVYTIFNNNLKTGPTKHAPNLHVISACDKSNVRANSGRGPNVWYLDEKMGVLATNFYQRSTDYFSADQSHVGSLDAHAACTTSTHVQYMYKITRCKLFSFSASRACNARCVCEEG